MALPVVANSDTSFVGGDPGVELTNELGHLALPILGLEQRCQLGDLAAHLRDALVHRRLRSVHRPFVVAEGPEQVPALLRAHAGARFTHRQGQLQLLAVTEVALSSSSMRDLAT